MTFTDEQLAIINSTGDIRINAVAGSGKTTTIIEYARARPRTSKILYLAFNKSVKLEATKKFADKGLTNVKVETAHSLAYRHVVFQHRYKVRMLGYKPTELVDVLKLASPGERHAEYILANHVLNFAAYYCNSDKRSLKELNYTDVIFEKQPKAFVAHNYQYLEKTTQLFLDKMNAGEIEITHDFYLKKFQLKNIQLPYDYILFDEGQDASAAMLDVFFRQKATKVIVGDRHQQIYGWRFAVNSLDKADFPTYNLSSSFRFNQRIADLAKGVLRFKQHIGAHDEVTITGAGGEVPVKSKAILARTNLGLLLNAIDYVSGPGRTDKLYFEGNINSYTYADNGTSLYDVLNLHNQSRGSIRDPLIKAMRDMNELEEYIDKTDDVQLRMMVKIVKEYGNSLPGIINKIKHQHVDNEKRETANVIFSTVHRCKGLEYDHVELVSDFITEEKLQAPKAGEEKLSREKSKKEVNVARLNEEINLLYVAVTRTRNTLVIPKELLPKNFEAGENIELSGMEHVTAGVNQSIGDLSEESEEEWLERMLEEDMERRSNRRERMEELLNEVRRSRHLQGEAKHALRKIESVEIPEYKPRKWKRSFPGVYSPWTTDMDQELRDLCEMGESPKEIAHQMGRSLGAVEIRMEQLKLND